MGAWGSIRFGLVFKSWELLNRLAFWWYVVFLHSDLKWHEQKHPVKALLYAWAKMLCRQSRTSVIFKRALQCYADFLP